MIEISPQEIAAEIGAEVVAEGEPGHPARGAVDSREAGEGDLFFGLPGATHDGGEFAAAALEAGAWGAVVSPSRAAGLAGGWVFAVENPLSALGDLARAWRRRLGADVVGITGSVGKTSVKDIARALLPGLVHANRENLNTEVGLPLTILDAPAETDVLVLEMAMRGAGQIAELAAIAEPDVGVVTNVGPVHVELLGSVEAIAAAKAELLEGVGPNGTGVVPADPGPLRPHLTPGRSFLTFGEGGDVHARRAGIEGGVTEALVATPAGEQVFHFPFAEAHNLTNGLAAVAAGVALGADLGEMADRAPDIGFSRFRGERVELDGGILLVNDCYNANPVSMRAALDHLATLTAERRIAVLGTMAELGSAAPDYHREVGEHARRQGVDLLVGVGEPARDYDPDQLVATPEDAAELLAAQLDRGDAVLVKGSRSAGLESVAEQLIELVGPATKPAADAEAGGESTYGSDSPPAEQRRPRG